MADELRKTEEATEEAYEAPAVEKLGSATELTAGTDSSSNVGDDSDLVLKNEVRPVESSLELLRKIRTR